MDGVFTIGLIDFDNVENFFDWFLQQQQYVKKKRR